MLTLSDFHPYQDRACDLLMDNEQAMLWLDMGLGKTAVTLAAFAALQDQLLTTKSLVVAPKRVCQSVWSQEAEKWKHLQRLRFSDLSGKPLAQRIAALQTPADVYLINYENLKWLSEYVLTTYISQGEYPPFDMVVYDEISRMKNTRKVQGMIGGRSMMRLMPYIRRYVGLTGTPIPNGYADLFGQYFSIDGGARLGTAFYAFRNRYFKQLDYMGYKWGLEKGADKKIEERVEDITLSMRNEEYLKLPSVVESNIDITLPPKLQKSYQEIEKKMLVELGEGKDVEVFNQASLSNRCLQFCNGAVYYNKERAWESIHDLKLQALDSVMEEAAGEPVLLAYAFQHDAQRIMKRYKGVQWIRSSMKGEAFKKILRQWKEGEVPLLLGHPRSMAHGIDGLQFGGRILCWFGLTWEQDLYDQAVGRLRRQGQTKPVSVIRITTTSTVEEDQLLALAGKQVTAAQLRLNIERRLKC